MVTSSVRWSLLSQCLVLVLVSGASARAVRDENGSSGRHGYADQLLLVSMDGFRWDYLNKAKTPNFDRMIREGVRAPYVTAPFLTTSLPSHYSIVTGLYEESHGIIDNKTLRKFINRTTDTEWWDVAEPIWINARKNDLTTGTLFWAGSETKVHGIQSNIWLPYERNLPFRKRVDIVVPWLADFRLNFVTLYFHEPDHTGHTFGPNSPEVVKKIEEMDGLLGYLLEEMDKRNLSDRVNIIVTSDHGMAETIQSIELDNFVNSSIYYLNGKGAVAQVKSKPGFTDVEVYNSLHDAHPNMTVYWRRDIPERWHYRNNHRIPEIFLVADDGWFIRQTKSTPLVMGFHGYDNTLESMRAIFVARGPNFRQNYVSQPFELISVYPLMCKMLGIPPAPNNGSLESVQSMLK